MHVSPELHLKCQNLFKTLQFIKLIKLETLKRVYSTVLSESGKMILSLHGHESNDFFPEIV